MNSVAKKLDQKFFAINVFFTDEIIGIVLSDGREVRVPLDFYPRLKNASSTQQNNFEIIGLGTGIHWPDIDEDLSVEGIVLGYKSI
jgi:hypothetical protein